MLFFIKSIMFLSQTSKKPINYIYNIIR